MPARLLLAGLVGMVALSGLPGCAGGCGPCSRWTTRRPLVGSYEPGISAGVIAAEPPATIVVPPGESLPPARVIPQGPGSSETIISDGPALSSPPRGTKPLESSPVLPDAPSSKPDDANELTPLPDPMGKRGSGSPSGLGGGASPAAYMAPIDPGRQRLGAQAEEDSGRGSPPKPLPGDLIPHQQGIPSLTPPQITLEAPLPDSPSGATSGFSPFSAVDSDLAGGTVPTAEGLDWLASLGYRTLVDLRDPGEGRAEFIREAHRRGFRYIACAAPVESDAKVALASFEGEINQAAARPIYFFDEEGQRSGALWYLHRKLTHKVADDLAREEAATLGYRKGDADFRRLSDAVAHPRPEPRPTPASAATSPKPKSSLAEPYRPLVPDAFGDAPVASHTGLPPATTMVALATILTITPLGYLGRTAFDNARTRLWASLRGWVRRS